MNFQDNISFRNIIVSVVPMAIRTFFFAIRRKAEGHIFQHSVLPYFRPPKIVGTLCAQPLL